MTPILTGSEKPVRRDRKISGAKSTSLFHKDSTRIRINHFKKDSRDHLPVAFRWDGIWSTIDNCPHCVAEVHARQAAPGLQVVRENMAYE